MNGFNVTSGNTKLELVISEQFISCIKVQKMKFEQIKILPFLL